MYILKVFATAITLFGPVPHSQVLSEPITLEECQVEYERIHETLRDWADNSLSEDPTIKSIRFSCVHEVVMEEYFKGG